MKAIFFVILIMLLLVRLLSAQEKAYWKNVPVNGTRIYSLIFSDKQNGYAVSDKEDFLSTNNGGETWIVNIEKSFIQADLKNNYKLWSADIYCSVMHTMNGGITWEPYSQEQQEHFCGVYLKDENTGYKIASKFLHKVSEKIFASIYNNQVDLVINRPQQCTEYFSNEEEGWALGWCLKNFKAN
jgi:hypothetical protein